MYSIIITPNYYSGTYNAPQESYLTWRDLEDNATDDIAQWDTEVEAQAIIDDLQNVTYYLWHGEAGRPDYKIVEDFNDGNDDCRDATDLEFCGFEEIDPADLPRGVQDTLDSLNMEHYRSGDDYDVYIADDDHDGKTYRIAYCPRSVALQIYQDDLGGLDWDHAAYFVNQ